MGKIIVVIGCLLLVLSIAGSLMISSLRDILGLLLIAAIILMAIGVVIIAKETRPQRF